MAIEQQGLAASGQQQEVEMAVQEIVKMLQNGANPDELINSGVPPELVQLAQQELSRMAQSQNQLASSPEFGMQQVGLAQG